MCGVCVGVCVMCVVCVIICVVCVMCVMVCVVRDSICGVPLLCGVRVCGVYAMM